MKTKIIAAIGVALCCVPAWSQQGTNAPDANAQNSAALEQRIREHEDRVIALEVKLRTMESAQTAQPQPAQPAATVETGTQAPAQTTVPAPAPSPNEAQTGLATSGGQLPVYGGSSAAAKALNPDVCVSGEFIRSPGGDSAPALGTLHHFPPPQVHE